MELDKQLGRGEGPLARLSGWLEQFDCFVVSVTTVEIGTNPMHVDNLRGQLAESAVRAEWALSRRSNGAARLASA